MVLMSVGDDKSLQLGRIVLEVSHIRYHEVDAEHIVFRERQSAVHHDDTVLVLKGSDVHTNLFEPAQRYDSQFSVFLFFQTINTSIIETVTLFSSCIPCKVRRTSAHGP